MFLRLLIRSGAVTFVVRGLATAIIAGIGLKIGSEAYDSVKRRVVHPRRSGARTET